MVKVDVIRETIKEIISDITDVYGVHMNYDEPSNASSISLHYLKENSNEYDKNIKNYINTIKDSVDYEVFIERAESEHYVFYLIVLL